eukprot:488825-Pyramimonas_sp.AAC.2
MMAQVHRVGAARDAAVRGLAEHIAVAAPDADRAIPGDPMPTPGPPENLNNKMCVTGTTYESKQCSPIPPGPAPPTGSETDLRPL